MMLERDLSPFVRDWLNGRGLVAYAEVPWSGYVCDFVGSDGTALVAVEMKRSLTHSVMRQAMMAQLFAEEAWCCVWGKPRARSLGIANKRGLGVLCVIDGVLHEMAPAEPTSQHVQSRYRKLMLHRLQAHPKNGDGGLRTAKGDGPAKRVGLALREFFTANPKATWDEAWRGVPNHYAHSRSMAQHHQAARAL